MKLKVSYHRLERLILSMVCFIMVTFLPQIAWAQDDVAAEEETKAAWLLAYCLVGLLIGLSLYSMCRPSVRRKKD